MKKKPLKKLKKADTNSTPFNEVVKYSSVEEENEPGICPSFIRDGISKILEKIKYRVSLIKRSKLIF